MAIKPKKSTLQQPNALPEIFIASSKENVEIAYKIQKGIEEVADVTVWDQDVFKPSEYNLDQIVNALSHSDFGVFVFTPNDVLRMRGKQLNAVRDNVLFEFGLFVGKLGRKRCFIVVPRGADGELRIASDLIGLNPLTYKATQENQMAALGPACHDIRQAVRDLGPLNSSAAASGSDEIVDIAKKVRRPAPPTAQKLSIRNLSSKKIIGIIGISGHKLARKGTNTSKKKPATKEKNRTKNTHR